MTKKEIRRLWRAAHRSTDTIGGVPGRIYWPAMIGLQWDTAERIGAVHALRWSDLDTRARCVYYRSETRKGGIADARKRFTRQTARALRKLERTNTPSPFASVKLGAMYYHWGLLREAARLPADITPHTLRRSHATYLRLAGGDAQASLGHSSGEITTRHYIDHTLDTEQPCDLIPRQPGWLARLWVG